MEIKQEIASHRFEVQEESKRIVAYIQLFCPLRLATNCEGTVELSPQLVMGNFPPLGWRSFKSYLDPLLDHEYAVGEVYPHGRCSGCGIQVEILPEVAKTLIPGAGALAGAYHVGDR